DRRNGEIADGRNPAQPDREHDDAEDADREGGDRYRPDGDEFHEARKDGAWKEAGERRQPDAENQTDAQGGGTQGEGGGDDRRQEIGDRGRVSRGGAEVAREEHAEPEPELLKPALVEPQLLAHGGLLGIGERAFGAPEV